MISNPSTPIVSRATSSPNDSAAGPRGDSPLDRPAQFLSGVGPRRAEALGRLGVHTVRDLLLHVPRRYEDASTVTRIRDLRPGTEATVIGEIFSKGVIPTRSGLRIFQAGIRDSSGSIECSWPGQPFLDRSLNRGDVILVAGPVRLFQSRQIQPREWVVLGRAGEERSGSGKVLPLYPATEGLSQKVIRSVIEQNLDRLLPLLVHEEPFPTALLEAAGVPTLMQALRQLHRPATLAEAEQGRRRLAWEELFFLQLLHARVRLRTTSERVGIRFERHRTLIAPLYRTLPFRLTDTQTAAVREIFADMTSPRRMNRLLQGDVGTGKTVVALFAMALAAENAFQSALMAPTEILAEQHARTLRDLTAHLPLRVALLTGRLNAAERREALAAIESGAAQLIVGTHALIQESVRFHRLGLAVVDEQHRFGVRQRLALSEPGTEAPAEPPDTLVMSATPIPRSLALTLYGDLDLTTLTGAPPGRAGIATVVRNERERHHVHEFVRAQVRAGRQAYIVYPLVESSEKVDLPAAVAAWEHLSSDVFSDLRVGLLHGQLTGEAKDRAMRGFAAGEFDILVATSVIEVGIDVANATVMVVEHAERFGLSQLHQLRGRVGRGAAESHCILLTPGDPNSIERLQVLADTDDGFRIARADLKLRGMGDFFGARQHGLPEFRFFDPERDEDLLLLARERASSIIREDPELDSPAHVRLRARLVQRWGERQRLFDVG
jgi:ATP-dependent DNA helicase RecG